MSPQTPAARPEARVAPRGWSLRARITAVIVAVAGLALAVAGGAAYLGQRAGLVADIDERLIARVELARSIVTGASGADAGAGAVPALDAADLPVDTRSAMQVIMQRAVPGVYDSTVALIDGRPAYLPPVELPFSLEGDATLMARVVADAATGQVRVGTHVSSALGELRYIAAPVSVGDDPSSGIYVVATQVGAVLGDLDSAFATYAWVAVGATVLVGALAWFIAGRSLRPLRELRATASRITVTDLGERIPVVGTDDVSELTRTVNSMLDRLDTSITAQRQLLDDVRHELKTPITVVRGHLELLDPADTEEVGYTRTLAIGELDRMADLVDRIELLAEMPDDTPRRERVDIASLTATVHQKASVIEGHEWVLAETADVTASADEHRLTQAWLQLADNAAKYSPPGTPIRIGSTRRDQTVELWVADLGAGIPAGMEERIFERFGRGEPGRGVRGSGLGLPIVKAIAENHGGRVSLSSSSAGSTFGVVIPIVPPTEEDA